MVLTVSFALFPVTSSFLPPSPRGLKGFARPVGPIETSARLDTSNGCQNHTTSPSAPAFRKSPLDGLGTSPAEALAKADQRRSSCALDDRSRVIRPAIPS